MGRGAVHVLAVGALCLAPVAARAGDQAADTPSIDPATGLYQPTDKDERGLWMQLGEAERSLRQSPLRIDDPALNAHVRQVFCRTVGDAACRPIRIYIMRTPDFNASMAPNGMMEVWSGLLLRVRNDAQLAAVLGHEFTHYQARHSIKNFHDAKSKMSGAVWASFFIGIFASLMIIPSIFEHSREMEQEADIGGLKLMAGAGYDTREAARIWEQLRAEMDATAAARGTKSRKDKDHGMFATHPPSAERVAYLTEAAKTEPGVAGMTGAADYAAAMQTWWPRLIDDQLKRNDFGASEYLIQALGRDGEPDWLAYAHGELFRRRGGPGDYDQAVGFYSRAIDGGGTVAELWRGRGLARLKLGQTAAGRADLAEYVRRAPDAADKAMMTMMAGAQG